MTASNLARSAGVGVSDRAWCADVKKRADAKIAEIEAKVRDLRGMARSLKALSDVCVVQDAPTSECPILDCFEEYDEEDRCQK